MSAQDLPDWLRKLYPFQTKTLDVDGHALNFVDEGQGRAVLLLHGNPTWSFYYRNLIQSLAPGRRCLAPDHIGCGLSAKPQEYPYRLEQHISNVRCLLDDTGVDEFDLVVHDWGGAIGMGVATALPERVGRIVILNTAAFPSRRIPWRIAACRLPVVGEAIVRGLNGFAWPATWMAVKNPLPANIRRGYLYPYRNWHERVAIARFVQDIPMSPKHPSWQTLSGIADALSCLQGHEMAIHWGMCDFCFDESFLGEWERRFPKAQVSRYPQAGHYVLEDARTAVIPAVTAFLNDVRRPPVGG